MVSCFSSEKLYWYKNLMIGFISGNILLTKVYAKKISTSKALNDVQSLLHFFVF